MTRKLLEQLKSDESLSSIIDDATVVSEKCSIPLNVTSPVYSIRSHLGTTEVNVKSFTRDFTTKICNKILDEMLLRFPPESMTVLIGIDSLNPKSTRCLEEKLLLHLVDHYGENTLQINKILLVFKVRKYKLACEVANEGNDESGIVVNLNPSHYPNLMQLFHLKRSLPVSSAEAERSFSTIKRVKSRLQNRLTDERLAELCLLSSERDLTKKLNIKRIIDIFNDKPRRVALR
ncbi:zinc finger MYM-type 1-like [Paramuricea clavata]|uniref:Zinc finger MYM-type 1-like n=1 Tax=Paramuricea clavata TaxID=317549 RepID=A0A6S7JZ78_PARCT|nr:zinc finger MYM-type 1-like [Paramuricea clavata]